MYPTGESAWLQGTSFHHPALSAGSNSMTTHVSSEPPSGCSEPQFSKAQGEPSAQLHLDPILTAPIKDLWFTLPSMNELFYIKFRLTYQMKFSFSFCQLVHIIVTKSYNFTKSKSKALM